MTTVPAGASTAKAVRPRAKPTGRAARRGVPGEDQQHGRGRPPRPFALEDTQMNQNHELKMHKQYHFFFCSMLADVTARHGELFHHDGRAGSSLSGGVCGAALTRTPSGFLACPRGHEKLLVVAVSKVQGTADGALLDLLGLDRSLFAAPPRKENPPPGSPPAVIPFTPLEEIGSPYSATSTR